MQVGKTYDIYRMDGPAKQMIANRIIVNEVDADEVQFWVMDVIEYFQTAGGYHILAKDRFGTYWFYATPAQKNWVCSEVREGEANG